MTKFRKTKKTESIFSPLDVSFEFNESVKIVFISDKKLTFILINTFTEHQLECVKSHIKEYYEPLKCEFYV